MASENVVPNSPFSNIFLYHIMRGLYDTDMYMIFKNIYIPRSINLSKAKWAL